MSDYTESEKREVAAIREEAVAYMVGVNPLADHYAAIAHFVMRKLREDRGYDFTAAEAAMRAALTACSDRPQQGK
jgi:hypothetical protein